jgi:hypothetical protein
MGRRKETAISSASEWAGDLSNLFVTRRTAFAGDSIQEVSHNCDIDEEHKNLD